MRATISAGEVETIARLARLQLTAAERQRAQQDLAGILQYFGTISQLATDEVDPLAHPLEVHSVLRDDSPGASYDPARSLQNAPAREATFFVVPRLLDQDGGG